MIKPITKSLFTISLALVLVAVAAGLAAVHPARTIAKEATLCGLKLTWDEPLFSVSDFEPGRKVRAVVAVSNTASEMRALGIEFKPKGDDPNFLASVINMTLSRPGKTPVTYTLKELYDKGEFKLSEFDSGEDAEIAFEAEFDSSAGNSYQGKKTEFDVVFGCYGEVLGDQDSGEGAVLGAAIGLPATGPDSLALVSALAGLGCLTAGFLLRRRISAQKPI